MPLNWFCLIWHFQQVRYDSFVLVWKKFFCFGKVTFAHIWGFWHILGFEFCRLECNYVFLEISRKKQNSSKTGEKLYGIYWCDEKFSWKNGAIHCHYLMFSHFFAKFRKNRTVLFSNRYNQQKKSFFHTNRWIDTLVPRLSRHLEISIFLVKS